MDETSGTRLEDCSGKENHGTISGAASFVPGKFGRGLSFNGSNTCVDAGKNAGASLSAFTVAAFVNVNDYANGALPRWIAGRTTDIDARGFRVGTEQSGGFGVKVGKAGPAFAATSPLGNPTGTWLHVAFAYAQGNVTFFVNGALVGSDGAAPPLVDDPAAHMRIGCFADTGNNFFFDGVMDEVRLYSRALSASEIAKLAQ